MLHDVLFIELNGLFYSAIGELSRKQNYLHKNNKTFHRELFIEITKQLEIILINNPPTKTVFMVVDGIAGMMKYREQQQRRFKNVLEKKYDKFDINAFTPGTKLMHYLTKYIDYFLRVFLNTNKNYQGIEIIFSNEKVSGEGESKIFRLMDKFCTSHDKILIYNCDSDIICLSIVSEKNIVICRKSSLYGTEFINIRNCRKQILKRISWNNQIMNKRYMTDLIVMIFLLGNDYVDSSPFINNFQILYQTVLPLYKKNRKFLTDYEHDKWSINYQNLCEFLGELGRFDGKFFPKGFEDDSTFPNALLATKEDDSKFSFQDYIIRYHQKYFSNQSMETVTREYFLALEQYLDIFMEKRLSSFSYKYFKSPFLSQLCKPSEVPVMRESNIPQENLFYLLLLLPPQSKFLLPSCFEDYFETMNINFPSFLEIDLSGKRTLWEGILNLPELDIENVVEYYNRKKLLLKSSDLRRNTPGKEFYYRFENSFPKEEYKCYYGNIHNNQVHVSILE